MAPVRTLMRAVKSEQRHVGDSAALVRTPARALAAYEGTDAALVTRNLATETCPHCARRAAVVETHLRLPGRRKRPMRLLALGAFASLAVVSLIPTLPLLAVLARHDERSMGLTVQLCRECAAKLRRVMGRDDLLYFGASALPTAVLIAAAALAAIGTPISMPTLIAAELTSFAIAGVAFAKVGARRRKRLPYLIASHGSGGWHARLPEAWRQVLEKEAPKSLRALE